MARKTTTQPQNPPGAISPPPFPVVGIGASAGGLAALREFFGAMPHDTGMVFVVIQHLIPDQKSRTAELLQQKYSRMPVREVTENTRVLPNHVYVIPPDRDLTIQGATLKLTSGREKKALHLPVDTFFSSLAPEYRELAIGVVLSGTGSDGTLGARRIKEHGGVVFAQKPESAEFDGMPNSVMRGGLVDQVLRPAEMAGALLAYIRHPYVSAPSARTEELPLDSLLHLLYRKTGHNFANYKRDGLSRRIKRRMGLRDIREFDAYARILEDDPSEVRSLIKDLLVGVTSFFRDPDAWEALRTHAIEPLVHSITDRAIRVWIPASATGEEAYTAAMLFHDAFENAGRPVQLQLYATDVSEEALRIAREGAYQENAMADIPSELRHRYFVPAPKKEEYRTDKRLRNTVTVARHNILTDPPFSHLDLIICRNFLIYVDQAAQGRLLASFHFALNEEGYLFLGSAEGLSDKTHLFEPVHARWRIFRRADVPIERRMRTREVSPYAQEQGQEPGKPHHRRPSFAAAAERIILRRHVPATVMIDEQYDILYLSGPINDFLRFPTGTPGKDLLALLPKEWHDVLRDVLYHARNEQKRISRRLPDELNPPDTAVVIEADPVDDPQAPVGSMLVTFHKQPRGMERAAEKAAEVRPDRKRDMLITQLRHELDMTRAELRGKVEQLKGSNEELQSSNEELQVSNEELETSREELQSLNEELTTVNSQLQVKIEELENTYNDLNNFITGTNIPAIFLDADLRVRRFTPAITHWVRFQESDIGRPLEDLAGAMIGEETVAEAATVMESPQTLSRTIQADDDTWFVRRIMPYRTGTAVDGVVITYWDVTEELKQRRISEANAARDAAVLQALNEGLVYAAPDGRIIEMNPAALRFHGFESREQAIREINEYSEMFELFTLEHQPLPVEQWPVTRALAKERFSDLEVVVRRKGTGEEWIGSYSGAPVFDAEGNHLLSILTIRDVTESRRLQRELGISQKMLTSFFDNSPTTMSIIDEDLRYLKVNEYLVKNFIGDYSIEQVEGKTLYDFAPDYAKQFHDHIREIIETGTPDVNAEVTGPNPAKPGENATWITSRFRIDLPGGKKGVGTISIDATRRKQAEEALRESEERLRFTMAETGIGAWDMALDDRTAYHSPQHDRIFGYDEPLPSWTLDDFMRHALPEHHESLLRMVEEATVARTGWTYECPIRRADGAIRWIWFTGRFRVDEHGRDRVFGVVLDTTERKNQEELLAHRAADLQAANDELESFAYTISHDLRGPLRSITSFSQMLLEDTYEQLDEEGKDYLRRINEAGLKMGDQIQDLLRLAWISRSKPQPEPIDLSDMAKRVADTLKARESARDITITVEDNLEVTADRRLMTVLLENLLHNAIKYTAKREHAVIEVGQAQQNDHMVFYINDNGTGFDMEHSGKLFKPFSRLHGEKESQGTGMGLAISRRIVELHRGAIWAESQEGVGTKVVFRMKNEE